MNLAHIAAVLEASAGWRYDEADGPRWVHRPVPLTLAVQALVNEAVNEALEAAAAQIEEAERLANYGGGWHDGMLDAARLIRPHKEVER